MNEEQLLRMKDGLGFIAALDQSGGSTPKALKDYGVDETQYHNEEEMFGLVHKMRTRIITSPFFTKEHILAAILFEMTMDRKIEGQLTADYLWNVKGIIPILKIDKGLTDLADGVQLMKTIPDLDSLLDCANERHIFGTKMRSVIKEANPVGVKKIVDQQFELAAQIYAKGLIPIIEPEVDIHASLKEKCEELLRDEIIHHCIKLDKGVQYMLKLTIPTKENYYTNLINNEHILRVVALSGGYSQAEADEKLAQNKGLIASFSRALSHGLMAQQTDDEFNSMLKNSIDAIYNASIA